MISCTGNDVGDTCTITCDDGFELSGSDTRTCQDDGTWSGTDATCSEGLCNYLHAFYFGINDRLITTHIISFL